MSVSRDLNTYHILLKEILINVIFSKLISIIQDRLRELQKGQGVLALCAALFGQKWAANRQTLPGGKCWRMMSKEINFLIIKYFITFYILIIISCTGP
jgi:hypothetical protein